MTGRLFGLLREPPGPGFDLQAMNARDQTVVHAGLMALGRAPPGQ
jgi:hypothetical protein